MAPEFGTPTPRVPSPAETGASPEQLRIDAQTLTATYAAIAGPWAVAGRRASGTAEGAPGAPRLPVATADAVGPLAGPLTREEAAWAVAQERAALPSPIAVAARRYGDRFPATELQWPIRLISALMLVLMFVYLVWMFEHLNPARPWLAWPFAIASVFSAICLGLSAINGWTRRVNYPVPLEGDANLPQVAVIIPTCGEPVPMVLRTVLSVLEGDYPADRRTVIVSDDGHSEELRRALAGLDVVYHDPPDRYAPERGGAPKSGNLNSALKRAIQERPNVAYIETRDADDELGSLQFLRQAIGQLEYDDRLAFVQTVKETQVSAGDPFCNLDSQFYRSQMLSRNAANAAFPCGSGLVWRRRALQQIGGFPTWNLVEDLQSGVEALRHGWHGRYLPIVGAVGQHSPEDVPNTYKQRGTWAIDTVRLMLWGNLKGLRLRQRLQFLESMCFYLHSFTTAVYVPCAALVCVSVLPLRAAPVQFFIFLLPYALVAEARLLLLNEPFGDRRRRQRQPLRALWRVKVMWIGMAPVYMIACVKAILGGPNRKPVYKVTRKDTRVSWYWRETMPQLLLAVVPPAGFVVGVCLGRLPSVLILVSAGYWGLVSSGALANFVVRGWFGMSPTAAARAAVAVLLPGRAGRASDVLIVSSAELAAAAPVAALASAPGVPLAAGPGAPGSPEGVPIPVPVSERAAAAA